MVTIRYHYLDSLKGSPKGLIGEIIFKESKKNIFCTKLCEPTILKKLPLEIPTKIPDFLTTNWHTLDCLEFKTKRLTEDKLTFTGIILYEIKTQKFNPNKKQPYTKCTFTKNQLSVHKTAKSSGMQKKLVKVLFFNNWMYSISILKLEPEKYAYVICNGSDAFQKTSSP